MQQRYRGQGEPPREQTLGGALGEPSEGRRDGTQAGPADAKGPRRRGSVGRKQKLSASDVITTVVQRVVIDEREPIEVHRHSWKRRRTAFVRWDFVRHGRQRSIEVEHGQVFGRRRIRVDGEEVLNERIVFDAGSAYKFEVAQLQLKLLLLPCKRGYEYELLVNQSKPFTDRSVDGETTFMFEGNAPAGPDTP